MRFITQIKQSQRSEGFTLIEVMIIAPVVILVVSGFIGLMITMVGDSLVTREQNNMAYETQDALDRIEQDTRLTTQFLVTSGTQIAPQGSNSNFTGTTAFSSTNTLILGGLTTDKNPTDSTRQLVYYANQPNDCGSLQTYNRVFQGKIMYFIKDGSLWRRSIVPDYNLNATVDDSTTCSAPWQRNTCSSGYGGATRCQTDDSEVMKNISTLSVKYLSTPGSSTDLGTAQALSANAIEVTITGLKTSKGRTITSSGTTRATKLNNIDVDLPVPTAPIITGKTSGTSATFTWPAVPNATSYEVTHTINGGSPTTVTLDNRTTTYTVNANRNDTVSVSIKAKNSTGTSPAGLAAATIPPWYACPLQNGWNDFGAQFAPASYTKTSTDIVMLKGIIKDGTTTGDTVVCTLPVGYRPTARIMFQVASNNGPARVDVFPTGEVAINFANNAWLALDTINFVASTASYPWTPLPRSNGWLNFDSGFSQIQSNIDSLGRVHVQGLLKSGTNTDPTTVATLPVGSQSPQFSFIPAAGGGGTFNYTVINNNRTISTKGVVNSPVWYSIQSMFYPASFGSWNPLTLQNSWTLFDPAYSTPQYAKGTDGIVKVKGMIKSGNTGAGIVIANLPVGYRPKETLLIHSVAWGAYARVDVQPNGDVTAQGVNSGWTSLDAITFIAEQ